jgi:tetratricopeptide (TPR) repeat protein
MRGPRRHLSLLVALALLTGCAVLFPVDRRAAEEVATEAEELVARKDYEQAVKLYSKAIAKQPQNGRYYLRRSELLEALSLFKAASDTYRDGLVKLAADAPERLEVIYRLALISAEHLDDIDTAETLLEQLPGATVPRLDLTGYLYYHGRLYEDALKRFNQALSVTKNADQKALILYHAALVYIALNDEKNAVTSLFHAINNATHLGLIRDISELWDKVNADQPLPRADTPET